MKVFSRILLLALFTCSIQYAFAKHVKGGHIEYQYNGPGSSTGTSNYTFTITVFFSCTTTGPKDNVYLGVFDLLTNAAVLTKLIFTTTSTTITKTSVNPCMSNPPSICYQVYTYVYTADIPNNTAGYVLAVQDALRIDGIVNITNSATDGITLTAVMPGIINGVDYHTNSSPKFLFMDTAIVCYQGGFTYQFAATDPDGDSLSYSFGNGLNVANPSGNTSSSPPAAPPYTSLTYTSGYSGQSPLGSAVQINPVSGMITGTAPATTGEYVVAVYVKEWRKGVLMDSVKKELQIYVYNCSLVAASLNTSYINCSSYTFNFLNESSASTVSSYHWDFGVPSLATDTSSLPTPTYTYPDTGQYTLRLKVSTTGGCTDSASAPVKVYPGFTPAFSVSGSCYQSPFQFTDQTTAAYGTVNSWAWNFGDPNNAAAVSALQSPTYQYASPGTASVSLVVGSTKGCLDTLTKQVTINGKPDLLLPFKDTLICSIDSLPLSVTSSNATAISWSPAYNIINATSATPIVYPKDTTVYTVTVQDKGCIDSAHITVNVLDYITVSLPADTTICQSDSIRLRPVTYGLSFQWTPSAGLNNSSIKYPFAAPQSTTIYSLTANLGKCQAVASQQIRVVPYPLANAGADTTICFNGTALLHGNITGSSFSWSPVFGVTGLNTLQPVAKPVFTTSYVLTAMDTLGCPKPFSDTMLVTVLPQIQLAVTHDTAVIVGQPLQLQASHADSTTLTFNWTPSVWLNNSSIDDPVAQIMSAAVDSIYYVVTATNSIGCNASGKLRVLVYKTQPSIFVPNAFTPNGDGRNDLMRPVLVGISRLEYFKVYNRWGQLVYSTSQAGAGWDGTLNGRLQDSGAFVYVVRGQDYTGKTIAARGSFVLIK